jgi:hypothetical protein
MKFSTYSSRFPAHAMLKCARFWPFSLRPSWPSMLQQHPQLLSPQDVLQLLLSTSACSFSFCSLCISLDSRMSSKLNSVSLISRISTRAAYCSSDGPFNACPANSIFSTICRATSRSLLNSQISPRCNVLLSAFPSTSCSSASF